MMTWFRVAISRLKGTTEKQKLAGDLTEELRSHREMLVEDNLRRGMSRDQAERHAQVTLGNATRVQENYRDQAGLPFLEVLWQDARFSARMLRKSPAFAAVAILTLALGIGANSAIFSVVNGVLLRPLPYEDPGRLMYVFATAPSKGLDDYGASPPDFRTLRQQNKSLASLSAYYTPNFNLTGTDKPERLQSEVVSSEFFKSLGVPMAIGRGFMPGEENWGSHHVAVVSHEFWRSHLNADPNLNGKFLNLNDEPYNVIGVLPAGFRTFVATTAWDPTVWVPMAWKPKDNMDSHNNYFLHMIGRLKPGVSASQAKSDLNAISLAIAQQFPENQGVGTDLKPLREAWVGDARPALLLLLGSVGLVLLIACVNLANLMLARSAARQKEIAIRSALGAGRGRLILQFLTESVLLSLLGGGLGLVLAFFSLRLLPLAAGVLPRVQEIRLDSWVLLFTLVVSLLTGLLFGLMPAWQHSHTRKLSDSLKEGGRTPGTAESHRVRAGLVVCEVALSLVLLIAAGLALKSFARLIRVDAGFAADHVLTFGIDRPQSYDPDPDPLRIGAPPRVAAFFQEVLDRIEQLPGVRSAGIVSSLPLQGENWGKYFVALDQPLPASIEKVPLVQYRAVSGHYFSALGVPLLKGRLLDEHDQAKSPLSVVVNAALARKFWPGQDAIGKNILLTPPESLIPRELLTPGFHPPQYKVVGVVADVRYGGLDQAPQPAVYGSILQGDYNPGPGIAVRTDGDPVALVPSIRSVLKEVDKNVPMAQVATMDELMAQSVAQPRLETILLGLFGGLAALLAAVGIYGVMSYSVNQRTSEIGIRMALGAGRANVLALVLANGLRLAALGLALGLVLAYIVTRLMSKILFEVSPTDPATFAIIALLLGLVALLACYIPARRATKVDPMIALRYE